MKNMTTVYLNSTGGTRKVCMALASAMSRDVKEAGFCTPDWERTFGSGDAVIVGVPVFGDRISGFVAEELKHRRGNRVVAVTAAVYGNRALEGASLELDDCLRVQGFQIAAGTALLAKHSMVGDIASGHFDEQDMEDIRLLTVRVLDELQEEGWQELQVPGNRPYRDWKQIPVVPVTNDSCMACGRCVKPCPAGVIPLDVPGTIKTDQCILCMRCVSVCPTQVRSLLASAPLALE